MTEHHLKTWPKVFNLPARSKPYEYRKNDRNFQIHDILYLEEWDPKAEAYTGYVIKKEVTDILLGGQFGIPEGYCIMTVIVIKGIHRDWNLKRI
jgi:hypothetical protein